MVVGNTFSCNVTIAGIIAWHLALTPRVEYCVSLGEAVIPVLGKFSTGEKVATGCRVRGRAGSLGRGVPCGTLKALRRSEGEVSARGHGGGG